MLTVAVARPLGSPVTVALRPEAITVEPLAVDSGDDAEARPNSVDAVVEQIVYHGFVSHLYLRLPNGEPLIAYQQNQGAAASLSLAPGMRVRARWDEARNHLVRD